MSSMSLTMEQTVTLPPSKQDSLARISENGLEVLRRRYLRKGLDGKPAETVQEMFWRVASNVALPERVYGSEAEYLAVAERFYDLLTELRFFPNSPTFTGAGTPLGQLAACFVLAIDDDMGKDSAEGIFNTLRNAALIQQTGGGNGFSFSRLRPKSDPVNSSAGVASGPVGFLRVYDAAFGEIAQGGTRRGANMGVLRVDHPDIEEFISCKATEGAIANFNISVGVTDAFMQAVRDDSDFELVNPHTHQVTRTVRARELFDKIIHYAHRNGEPGVLFLDAANRSNPVPHLYELEATNPCTTGDTLVATPHGWRRVDQISVGDKIYTGDGIGSVARVEINPNMLVYRVVFSDGGYVRATASHQFHVRDRATGEFSPKRLDALRLGEEVRVLRPMPMPAFAGELVTAGIGPVMDAGSYTRSGEGVASVLSITPDAVETVYDLFEPTTDTWITAGYVSRGCGEQFLGPYENCCLGSVNLSQHITAQGQIDWAALERTVVESTRFLDDVVSANKYVPAVPQLQDAAHRVRRIGLGVMGLADVMYKIGVRYGDQESLDLAGQVMEFVRYHCMRTSIELARERGPFPAISGSIYDPENLKWQPPTPLQPYSHSFARPEIDWNAIVEGIKVHGIRNGAQTTVAPTGTIGTVTGCEGYGCEPVFALAYTRYVKEAGGDVALTYVSPLFLEALDQAGIIGERRERIVNQIVLTGTCQGIDELPQDLQHTFVVSQDITPTEHVLMQAALQRYVDNSISKTCNFPPEAAPGDVAQAYVQAWELGCKGLTVYVTGSRQEVVLETKATADAKKAGATESTPNGKASAHETVHAVAHQVEAPELNGNGVHHSAVDYDAKRPRPRRLHGATYRRLTPLGTAYVTVNDTDEGEPFEVFMNVGKAGSDVAAVSEALGRLISLTLRLPSSLTPTERLQQVVFQLNGIGGGRHLGFGPQRVRSLPDAIAQVLTEHLEQTFTPQPVVPPVPAEQLALPIPKQIGDLCPDCGNSTLLNVEGCVKCHVCGYSEC
jgi:ribonucleotide reductase alpha subunit